MVLEFFSFPVLLLFLFQYFQALNTLYAFFSAAKVKRWLQRCSFKNQTWRFLEEERTLCFYQVQFPQIKSLNFIKILDLLTYLTLKILLLALVGLKCWYFSFYVDY